MSDASVAGATERDQAGSGETILAVRELKKHFSQDVSLVDRLLGGKGKVKAVDGVDLAIEKGETVAVVGESGCGKTTLGRTILNLERPTGGEIRFRGEDIAGLTDKEMRPYRREMQIIFQNPLTSLNPRQTVGEILTIPMKVHGIGDDARARKERARELLAQVGLQPEHMTRYPRQFSGGQQQRIAIARALTVEPDLLVADEPVSALDVSVQAKILNLLRELRAEFGLSMLYISHDLSTVRYIADRVNVMYLGEIVETAAVDALFENPRHPYTKALLSAVPQMDPTKRSDRILLQGTVPSPVDPPEGCRFHTRCPAVIPPEDWRGDHDGFRRAFEFRTRLEAGEIEVENVRERLRSEDRPADDDAVADFLVARTLEDAAGNVREETRRELRTAVTLLIEGDEAGALRTVREALPSVCEREKPRYVESEESDATAHLAACHRLDPEQPGDADFL